MDPFDVLVLQIVGRAGLLATDQIADRLVREDAETLFGRRRNLEATLERLELRGYLEARDVAYAAARGAPGNASNSLRRAGNVVFDKAYHVTRRTALELNFPLPPSIRESFVEHHLKTMDALARIEDSYRARGCRILGFKTESELIREDFQGRVEGRVFDPHGEVIPKFPDATLSVEHPDGHVQVIAVEYVSAKYTDEQIREKHESFEGPVVWAVPTQGTALRVAAITGEEPLLL